MQKKAILLGLLLALLVGFGVVQAMGHVVIPDELPTGIEVEYWHEWDGAQKEAIDMIIADFNANNEYGITVVTQELGSSGPMREAVSAGIQSGELPNLTGGFSNDAQGWFLDGAVVPLDPYMMHPTWGFSEDEMANLNTTVIDVNRVPGAPFDDQLLAWSIGFSGVTMSVNLDMLAELGFDAPPATLEEFREVACAANEFTGPNGEDTLGFPLRLNPQDMHAFILSQGGSIWDEATMQFDFDNQVVLDTLAFFQQLLADGCAYIPETNFKNTADFAAWLNPMAVGSTVGVPFIQRDAVAATEAGGTGVTNWVNTTTPWSEGNRTLVLNFRSIIMLTSTPEEQLATWLFIKHMASDAMQQIWTELTLYQPYTQSALENLSAEWLAENTQFEDIRQLLLDEGVRKYGEPQILGYFQGTGEFGNLISQVVTDPSADIAALAAEAEVRANELLAEAQEGLE
jgi:multiple sugar transport system substrate-binding protein/sn-glycerol 3-phosphate transport system substrate-binding protein